MKRGLFGAAALLALALASCAEPPIRTPPPALPGPYPAPAAPVQSTLPLSALPGWKAEDHAAAFRAFRGTCQASRTPDTAPACAEAQRSGPLGEAPARRFFETRFQALGAPDQGLLTAYFTPAYPARRDPDAEFSAAVRPAPADLKTLKPYPDRAAIEDKPPAKALAWLRPEDLFFLQVQGSGLLVFEDGRQMKAVFAGTNGRPYLAIGRFMRDEGLLAPEQTSAGAIHRWLADHRGPQADALMRRNPRYAFFSLASDDGRTPAGSAGVSLPARRAVAVDAASHPMGELLWIDADQPALAGAAPRYAGLVLALDTGGAIHGAGRADLYLGSGPEAGAEAGLVQHRLRLYRLVPRGVRATEAQR